MSTHETYEVSNKIFTLPNVLSFIRLLMIPVFLVLLFNDFNLAATLVFAIAASTDWVDGQVARRTNQVSRLGQLLDPAVDRLLMISGVAGLFFIGRLPLWIILFVLIRDLILLVGGAYILERYKVRVPVIYLGKVATTLLYIGFAGILLNFPLLPGLGVCDLPWLPGFSAELYSWGFWFAYAGIILNIFTTSYYIGKGLQGVKRARKQEASGQEHG
ncbi:CDP-alcohol phosphatidyltransferase family protein [Anaerotardibacter muris]|uniref:CDP-alcohol phosphatidyltransferase family protein n=1 Tax=Anaerotardibacter muris TaxID=2941505 RepID=UPI00203C82D0|nr:CDP-alcohol phosphatidyltransferase family protein [Anaerotardibacter muris]